MCIPDILDFLKVASDIHGAAPSFAISNPIICIFPEYSKGVVHIRLDLIVENRASRTATIPSAKVSFAGGPWYVSRPRNPIADNADFHEELAKAAPSGPLSESASELPATIPPLEMRRILLWLTVSLSSELPGQLLEAVYKAQSLEDQARNVSTMSTACTHGSTSCYSTAASTAAHRAEDGPPSPADKVLQLRFLVRGKSVSASVVLQPESF